MKRIVPQAFSRWLARVFGVLALCWCAFAASSSHVISPAFPPNEAAGRLLVLPGIHNTLFHLDAFVEAAQISLPNFSIELRKWGLPLLGIRNLRAEESNRAVAQRIAADIARWRDEDPEALIFLMGYSGGGGIAALTLAELPEDVTVDRLILVAPAISSGYEIERLAAEHVEGLVVNFASEKDLQVGIGTRLFGTIDRKYEYAAGFGGFEDRFEKLVQWHWRESDRQFGHRGNHVAYLGRRWQLGFLLPAVDPRLTSTELARVWERRRALPDGD